MIDAASGGALGDMTPAEARNLIEKMASNSQQFSARNDAIVIRGVHEVATNPSASSETKKLEGKLDALVNLVTQLALNQKSVPVARVCGLCSSADHHTDLCPSMQQPGAIEQPEAYAANIYNRPPQPQQQNQPQQNNYDLSSNRYNPGWRNHPNLRWSSPQQQQQQPAPSFQNVAGPSRPYIPPPIQQQQQPQKQPTVEAPPQPSLEELVRQMTMQNMQFQQETRASIQSLTNQMGQLATQLNQQ